MGAGGFASALLHGKGQRAGPLASPPAALGTPLSRKELLVTKERRFFSLSCV